MYEKQLVDAELVLKKYKDLAENDPNEYIPLKQIIEDIESQPLVDAVEVVRSKWVWIPVAGVMRFRCGNIDCCRSIPFGCSPSELKYCPYCGASMEGEY